MRSLGDFIGNADISTFPQIALVIFFLVFAGILVYVAVRRKGYWDRASRLPLEDDSPEDLPEGNQR